MARDAKVALDHVLNYPNPFVNRTTFQFDHNKSGQNLKVQVVIMTVSGKIVKPLPPIFLLHVLMWMRLTGTAWMILVIK